LEKGYQVVAKGEVGVEEAGRELEEGLVVDLEEDLGGD